jgi:thiamine biosynthesis lipoprotein
MDAIGYDRDIRLVLDGDEPIRAIVSPRPGWRSVRLNGNHLTVPAHLALDLGATAKALAADLVASRVSRALGCGVLLSLGGDISTAGAAPGGFWDVFVQDLPSDPADRITLPGRFAIATSSTQKRRWRRAHDAVHHILDPRTGRPADPHWRSVTVIAPRCTLANTLATSAVVRGSGALAMLESHGVPARLVAHDGTVVHTDRWAWSDFAKAV